MTVHCSLGKSNSKSLSRCLGCAKALLAGLRGQSLQKAAQELEASLSSVSACGLPKAQPPDSL